MISFRDAASCARVALLLPILASSPGLAADGAHYTMQTHAAFFSAETNQAKALDPQVFIASTSARAGVGPQNIQHVAGVRPAFIKEDAGASPLVNAHGEALGFNLADWLAAKGDVTITPASGGKVTVSMQFTHLVPGGHYSLFENHFDQQPIGFTPLDGAGNANDFVAGADGSTKVEITAPKALTKDNAVLLVYHSDKTSHGKQRGDIGINAHHQIIVPTDK